MCWLQFGATLVIVLIFMRTRISEGDEEEEVLRNDFNLNLAEKAPPMNQKKKTTKKKKFGDFIRIDE